MNKSILLQKFKGTILMNCLRTTLTLILLVSVLPLTRAQQIPDCNTIMACNDLVQISLGTNCTEIVVADMILEDQAYPNNMYTVLVTNANGSPVTSNVLTKFHIGKTLTVSVKLDNCDLSCWGNITVEDKLPPVISNCPSATLLCGQSTAPGNSVPRPTAVDACSTVTLTSIDQEVVSQCSAQFVKVITRTWTATDAYGNKSTCAQTINIVRPTIEDVNFPPNYDDIDKPVFECTANIKLLPSGAPHPDVTGYPGGTDCPNIMYFYNDVIFNICGASRKVLRQWTVIDWCTGRDTVGAQVIKILDTQPPVCVSPPDFKFDISTDEGKCTGTFVVPAPNVVFECSAWDYVVGYKLRDLNGQPFVNPIYDNVVKTTRPDGTYFYTITGLPADTSWIVYTITDKCDHTTQCFTEVIVKDKEAPTPVCEGFTVVSLEDAGWADVYATSMDDGSSDNCGVAKFEIRRLTNNCGRPEDLLFRDKVNFCCEDVSSDPLVYHKVVLRVYDNGGNYADCVANVKVQDKKPPRLDFVPPAITIDCDVDYKNLANTGGTATANDNCTVTITFTDSGTLKCGLGTITRTWRATDRQGLVDSKTQIITIKDSKPFSINDIIWPTDLVINGCDKADANPDLLQSKPVYTNSNCADIAISYNDESFSVPGACLKILRTWRVIDWCNANPQNPQYIIHVQKITLQNSEIPVFISGCSNRTINSINSDCEEYVEHSVTATDDCTVPALLRYSWAYDEDNNGTIDQTGTGSFYGRVYPSGKHKMTFTVKDLCENATSCSYIFTVKDNKAPTPICLGELVWVLDENGKAEVWASDFDLKSEDLCDGDDLKFYFNANGTQAARTFTCADVPNGVSATIPLKMYVFDTDGNSEYCDVKLILQDSPLKNACPNTGNLTANISGKVINKTADGFENIAVDLKNMNNASLMHSTTEAEGKFGFNEVPFFNGYVLNPAKNDDILNGVSTLDLVLIQRHVLGIKLLDNPYDIIAADVNKDKKISASDLVSLRKVILGVDMQFANNDAWRFVPSNFSFADPKYPHDFPVGIEVNELINDIENLDFTAVKTGDVNNSASYSLRSADAESRTAPAMLIATGNVYHAKEAVEVEIRSGEDLSVSGIQFALNFDESKLVFKGIQSGLMKLNEENYNFSNGVLKISTDSKESLEAIQGDVLFTLLFESKKDGDLSSLVLSDELSDELYDESLNVRSLKIEAGEVDALMQTNDLLRNHPNPFTESTTIQYKSTDAGTATLWIADATGKTVMTQTNEFNAGSNKVVISRNDLGGRPGVYFYQIELNGTLKSGKLILAK
ncbi:MAG: T9SS type A sorting domain-containing protein [Saprospiraceae bacterium]|nr:T9SS type A sorting domain-containing protein [Saprospiraceae bacterium]